MIFTTNLNINSNSIFFIGKLMFVNITTIKPFILVSPVALTAPPRSMSPYISAGDLTTHSERPSTNTPRFLSSLIVRLFCSGFSKSEIFYTR